MENKDIKFLKGVGEKRAEKYAKLGVSSVKDLIEFYPRNYIDYTNFTTISQAILNDYNIIKAKVYKKQAEQRIRKGLSIFKVFVTDGETELVITIFNSKYLYDKLQVDNEYIFYGKVTGNSHRKEMSTLQFINYSDVLTMQPIYNLTEGLSNKMVSDNVKTALNLFKDDLIEPLTNNIVSENQLCHNRFAIEQIHFPKDNIALNIAKNRLIFNELLTLQLGLNMLKMKNRKNTTISLQNVDLKNFFDRLPFELTKSQKNAINDCVNDMKKTIPMNRLLQGDVGSGKTMVAAAIAYLTAVNNYQSAIMAPTEILAEQHFNTFVKIFEKINIKICLLTGSLTAKRKKEIKQLIQSGYYHIIIGTHALVQETVLFKKLGLVVTDEQHRFGVNQRGKLEKKGDNPHKLVMSATPIPRTLALIIYGDLDISIIDELPKGRQTIKTYSITKQKRARAFDFIKKHIEQGEQTYIICPAIDQNETDLFNVVEYEQKIKQTCLKDFSIGVLHGKLKTKQKEEIMEKFYRNEIQILISTTVVEVGVDVPNATIMLIENAERFGLSQLHQLRGRVGRGDKQSYCILLSDKTNDETTQRLKVMCDTSNGFVIAEQDLKQRGAGEFFGQRQHGLPRFKIANMVEDFEVLKKTQEVAKEIINNDLRLEKLENKGLRKMVIELFTKNDDITYN